MEGYVEVANAADVPEGGAVAVEAHGFRVALFRVGERFHAILARCPHAGGPLEEGRVKEGTVTCPWHGSRFDLATGERVGGPAPTGVPVFPVQVEGDRVLVGPPPAGTEPAPPSMF